MTTPTAGLTARETISIYRFVTIVLVVVGALTWAFGWPRDLSCEGRSYGCGGTSGDAAAIWAGLGFIVAAVFPAVVWATAIGSRLAGRLEQEEASWGSLTEPDSH